MLKKVEKPKEEKPPIDPKKFLEGYKSFDPLKSEMKELLKTDSRFLNKINDGLDEPKNKSQSMGEMLVSPRFKNITLTINQTNGR